MKKLSNTLNAIAVSALLVACNNAPKADVQASEAKEVQTSASSDAVVYQVATNVSDIRWTGFKTYADASHKGKIMMSDGEIKTQGDEIIAGNFIIDMSTITNEDLPEEGNFNQAKLIGHLSSQDFFYVEKYPTSSFTITEVKIAPEDHELGITHMLSGNLEMRGNSKNITVPATIKVMEDELVMTTPEFVIDRTQWEVEALSTSIAGLAKENLVDDNIKLQIELTARRS